MDKKEFYHKSKNFMKLRIIYRVLSNCESFKGSSSDLQKTTRPKILYFFDLVPKRFVQTLRDDRIKVGDLNRNEDLYYLTIPTVKN